LRDTKFELSNKIKLGFAEVEVMEIFMTGVKKILEFEKAHIAKLKADAAAAAAAA
jgi:protein-arginine kinase